MASAPVGEIPVLITGDWSELQTSIDQAAAGATAGAQQIATAFSAADTGAVSDLDSKLQELYAQGLSAAEALAQLSGSTGDVATQLEAISGGSDAAATSLGQMGEQLSLLDPDLQSLGESIDGQMAMFGEWGNAVEVGGQALETVAPAAEEAATAVEHAGESAHEAEGGFGELAEQLLKFGEALAVTEALKEFGEEALKTFGEIEQVSISLTALTGSASGANEMLEKLKALSLSDALSFPEVAKAAQKMTALGFSTEQVESTLKAAANSAAATGNSFGGVANAIDRMVLSGTAGARQLATLGISADALGKQMDVSASEVKKAFLALDQTERLEAITGALQKFSGVAEAAAAGITGQWKNLGTQFEFVMEEIGKALAPVVSQIISFIKIDVLPYIQRIAEAFNELPGPVKDAAVAFGLVLAALAPIAVAVGGFGLALAGISAAIAPLEALGAAMVAFATETVPAAITALGEFALTTIPAAIAAVGAFATALVTEAVATLVNFATVILPAAGAALVQFGLAIPKAIASLVALASTAVPAAIAAFTEFATTGITAATSALASFAATAVAGVRAALTTLAANVIPMATAALAVLASAVALAAAAFVGWQLGSWLYNNVGFLKAFGDGIADIILKIQSWLLQSQLMTEVMAKMGNAQAQANLATEQLAGSVSALAQKLAAHNVVIQQGNMTLEQYSVALRAAVDNLGRHANAADISAAKTMALKIAQEGANVALTDAQRALVAVVAAYDKHNASAADVKIALDKVNAAAAAAEPAVKALAPAHQAAAEATSTHARAIQVFNQFIDPMIYELNQARIAVIGITQDMADWSMRMANAITGLQQVNVAANLVNAGLAAMVAAALATAPPIAAVGTAVAGVGTAAQASAANLAFFGTTTGSVSSTISQVPAACVKAGQGLQSMAQIGQAAIKQLDTAITNDLGAAFQGIIMGTGKVGASFVKLGQDILKVVLDTIIKSALQPLMTSLDQAMVSIMADFGVDGLAPTTMKNAAASIGQSGQQMASSMQGAASSIQASAASMVSGLTAVAAVVSAIASIFSAIELMHTNTLLDRIEHETARMAIYLGDSGSNSIQFYTGKTAEFLSYIHSGIVSMATSLTGIGETLKTMLGVLAAGGGGGGGGAVDFAALQKEIQDALAVFKEGLVGPYGLGTAVSGLATATGAAAQSTSYFVSTVNQAATAASTLTSAATAAALNVNSLTAAVAKAATAITAPVQGINSLVAPTTPASPAAGPGAVGFNSMVMNTNQPTFSVTVNNSGPVVGSNGMNEFTQIIQNKMVTMLQTQGIRVTRG